MSSIQTPIRKNDNVVVIAGKDRGKRGRVLRLVPGKNRLIVEGVNFVKKHTRPNPGQNVKGGIVEREAPFHVSNVQLVCPECGAATRIGRRLLGDGRKVRIWSSIDEQIERAVSRHGGPYPHEGVRVHQRDGGSEARAGRGEYGAG